MSRERDPRAIRELAEQVLDLGHLDNAFEIERRDIVTSLTRQWLTYDGHAVFVTGKGQIHIDLLGPGNSLKDVAITQTDDQTWFRICMRDWDFGEEEFGAILNELNLGQSAILENRRGVALRIWINPLERTKGIEPVEPEVRGSTQRVNYRKLAHDSVEQLFHGAVTPSDLADLSTALARQWITGNGNGMIVTPDAIVRILLLPQPSGGHLVETKKGPLTIGRDLLDAGVPSSEVAGIVHRLNLGQIPEFVDRTGRRFRLVSDPANCRVHVEPTDPPPAEPPWFQITSG